MEDGVIHRWLEVSCKTMVKFEKSKFCLCCSLSKPPTMPLPLQTTASIFLDKQSSVLSILDCLLLWPPPSWLQSCRPFTTWASWGLSRSHTSWCSSLSLSTFILMQLPAFLRALTASWWVAPCMLRPLTWMDRGHIILLGASESRSAGQRWGFELHHGLHESHIHKQHWVS